MWPIVVEPKNVEPAPEGHIADDPFHPKVGDLVYTWYTGIEKTVYLSAGWRRVLRIDKFSGKAVAFSARI